MNRSIRGLRKLLLAGFLLLVQAQAHAQYPCPKFRDDGQVASREWRYSIELKNPDQHLLHVTLHLSPTSPDLRVQLPVWNAVYQVRDFAEHVNWLRATDAAGHPVAVRQLDKTTWSVPKAASVEYEIVAADPGPFGADFSQQHAFLNLAQVLVYPVGRNSGRVDVSFTAIPANWRVATPLQAAPEQSNLYCADSYDHLVDSPVEAGTFRDFSFEEGGGTYRVIIDSAEDYNSDQIVSTLKKLVHAETEWMQDRPFRQYTFIYHLPHAFGRGGMEHAYSTAIDSSAARLKDAPLGFESTSAHEFFHLWNVKRIRPQSLEPIDYTKENYTRALWFSEGVDSTVSEYMLARAGMLDEKVFLDRLAAQITALEIRPAHKLQSAEESSLDAWLEKYPYYRSAERSVNYYDKGQILGVLLDLAIRDRTHGQKSLRDLFQWMNEHYAKQGKFFDDSNAVREAAEAVTGADLGAFFQRYVSGTDELPYNEYLKTVGLNLENRQIRTAYPGFAASTNFGPTPIVVGVDPGGEAEKAGLHPGDIVLAVNGEDPQPDLDDQIASLDPGSTLKLKVSTRNRTREVKIKLTARSETQFVFRDEPNASPEQIARRAAWLRGDSEEAH